MRWRTVCLLQRDSSWVCDKGSGTGSLTESTFGLKLCCHCLKWPNNFIFGPVSEISWGNRACTWAEGTQTL